MSSSSSTPAGEALACPTCARRYPPEERFCADCGMPLVHATGSAEEPRSEAHARARKIRPEYSRGDLVRVAGGRNQAEAELIQNLLIEEGVPSVLRRSAGFDVPDFLAAGQRDVLVPESGAEAARDLLNAAELGPRTGSAASGPSPALLLAAILGGGLVTALIAWLLMQAG
jgi:pimeloyl-ACP methyl ester carboxylesterase